MQKLDIKDIKIRRAVTSDINNLASMQLHAWQSEYQHQPLDKPLHNFFLGELHTRWNKRLSSEFKTLVTEVDKNINGFITYRSYYNEQDGSTVEIDNLYVSMDWRQNGLGSLLWKNMLHDSRNDVLSEVIVWILKDDEATKTFYEKLGLIPTQKTRSEKFGKNLIIEEIMLHLPFP